MTALDHTHDPNLRSFVASANGHPDFPIQNLPLGIFTPPGATGARIGTAIGDEILDLAGAHADEPFHGDAGRAVDSAIDSLEALFALGPVRAARCARSSARLAAGSAAAGALGVHLHRATDCTVHLPARIGDYTDFYAGIHHATNVGKLMRPDSPLMPNYKYVPIGYHGRASSVIASGTAVRRPNGQRKRADDAEPTFGPCRNLDYELELGIWIGPGNHLGEPVAIGEAGAHIAGYCLLNDWSARDVQGWEYQPLGPFLAKSFATTLSPWVITPEALAPFRIAQTPRPAGDPAPLAYLHDAADQENGALDVELEVTLTTATMRAKGMAPHRLTLSNARHLYWTPAQFVAHHASNGCNLRAGDLFGSGTISAPSEGGEGSLLELTHGGRRPLQLASGEERRFLEDGDEIVLRARARRDGAVTIGFGECRGVSHQRAPIGSGIPALHIADTEISAFADFLPVRKAVTTWDETKRQENIAKHRVDLALAVHFDADRAIVEEDTSEAYGEQRFLALGPIGDRLYVYCFTYRGEADEEHAISLRLAAPRERRDYARKIQDH